MGTWWYKYVSISLYNSVSQNAAMHCSVVPSVTFRGLTLCISIYAMCTVHIYVYRTQENFSTEKIGEFGES